MQSVRIGREQAAELDDMLRKCNNQNEYFEYTEPDIEKYESLCVTADILEGLDYVKILSKEFNNLLIVIKQSGKTFLKNDSFISRIEKEEENQRLRIEQQKIDQANYQLTLKQIKAAKREPYIIVWSVIATFTTIILAILQLAK